MSAGADEVGVEAKVVHPLKGEFDTGAAVWKAVPGDNGDVGLEVGFADNGMVALRTPGDPGSDLLIYTPSEWQAFVAGVKDGEFDLATFHRERQCRFSNGTADSQ